MGVLTKMCGGAGALALALAGALAGAARAQDSAPEAFIRGGGAPVDAPKDEAFERDRAAILGMAGNYEVRFDFIEMVAFDPDYELKERDISGGTEMVRVLEDAGTFISLQHTLVMHMEEMPEPIVVKHWRQDWRYEPDSVMAYQGLDLWEAEPVAEADRDGAWSQTVYQVDDSLRYAAAARWRHDAKISTWEPPVSWRPLPRRDDTTRDDYNVIAGVNRHTVSPGVWWHEQDNSKMILEDGVTREIVREAGVNTYRASDDFSPEAGEVYWRKTGDFWAEVRALWRAAEDTGRVAVHDTPQGELLYMPMLEIAAKVEAGELALADAVTQARALMEAQVETGEAARQTAEAD